MSKESEEKTDDFPIPPTPELERAAKNCPLLEGDTRSARETDFPEPCLNAWRAPSPQSSLPGRGRLNR